MIEGARRRGISLLLLWLNGDVGGHAAPDARLNSCAKVACRYNCRRSYFLWMGCVIVLFSVRRCW